jgi:signal transduction histidine kinase
LASVIGFTELAMEEVPKGTDLAGHLEEILIGGKRAKLLVQQILAFSRRAPATFAPLRMDASVREAARLVKSTTPADIEIDVDIQPGPVLYVMGDETQIHQIILNLCANAGHAMETQGGKLTIRVDAFTLNTADAGKFPDLSPGRYVRLSVRDTGTGVPPGIVEHIFDPYFSTKEPGRGTGLGLAVVEGIVKAHKGHIAVVSRPQEGSTFSVFLPLLEKAERVSDRMLREGLPGGPSILFLLTRRFQL